MHLQSKGQLAIVLHAHLPFVRHPEHEWFLEEDWLFEAITECYIPLVLVLRQLRADEVPCRLTLSISPTLAEMLSNEELQSRYLRYLRSRLDLAEKEILRTARVPALVALARMYHESFEKAYQLFEVELNRNLIQAFRELKEQDSVEIMVCPATHAFLPFVSNQESRRAQLLVAQQTFQKCFGQISSGLWLAECGYEPKLDPLILEAGFKYIILDAHALLFGSPQPSSGIFAPVKTPVGLLVFGRDMESGRQVWSSQGGYPGDADYREFYRDIGFDVEYEHVRPYLHPDGVRRNLGIKYHKITGTGDLGQRELYDRERALAKAAEHAGNFIFNRGHQIEYLHKTLRHRPTVVSPYDAELFGHWWFEGPQFLDQVIRKTASDQSVFELVTLAEAAAAHPNPQRQQPAMSSWGAGGYHQVWLNERTQWIYRHQHRAESAMVELVDGCQEPGDASRRALNQAARELLLAQSSDWAFLISQGNSLPYALRRFRDHIGRFHRLRDQIMRNEVELDWLKSVEAQDNLFPDIDYRVFGSVIQGASD
jgi:1,4-alpha-glucan branching enzyme